MKRTGAKLTVVEGRADAPRRIALSLINPRGRVDISVHDVIRIEALAEQTFFFADTWTSKTYPMPHVGLEFAPHVGAQIHRLTSQIVGEELSIVVVGKIVSRPIVREPHGLRDKFNINVHDMDDAQALAAKLREGWVLPPLRVVGSRPEPQR